MSSDDEADMDLLPLEEGVLTVNFGMPLMIVCNKSEKVDKWSSQTGGYKFDYVMRHVR